MAAERTVFLYFDVNAEVFYDATGSRVYDLPYIYYAENYLLLQIQLVTDSLLTQYTGLASAATFEAIINNSFGAAEADLCRTENSNINVAGDWVSAGTANKALGQLSIRFDAFNSDFIARCGSAEEVLNTYIEITPTLDLKTPTPDTPTFDAVVTAPTGENKASD